MKNLIIILLLSINIMSFAQTERETQMINEINEMRTNPKSYIIKVEGYIELCDKKLVMISNGKMKSSVDMINLQIIAAEELINVLNGLDSLSPLEFNVDMYKVSKSHGEYLKSINNSTHKDGNGNFAPQRMKHLTVSNVSENLATDNGMITPTIVMLLVDAGIKSRGHRDNLLNPNSKFISVYTNGDVWVQNFAI